MQTYNLVFLCIFFLAIGITLGYILFYYLGQKKKRSQITSEKKDTELLINQGIKILSQQRNLSREELFALLRSIPGETKIIFLQMEESRYNLFKRTRDIPIDTTTEFCEESGVSTGDKKTVYKNIFEALIGEPWNNPKYYAANIGIHDNNIVFHPLSYLEKRHTYAPAQETTCHLAHFSISDIGMNILTINVEYDPEQWVRYIIKWEN